MFAQACGGRGFRVARPQALGGNDQSGAGNPGSRHRRCGGGPSRDTVDAASGSGSVWKFGIGKLREIARRLAVSDLPYIASRPGTSQNGDPCGDSGTQ